MRTKILLPTFLGLLLCVPAICQQDGQAITTRHGHRFINHTNGATPKARSGEIISVNFYTWVNDSLISSSMRDMGGPREVLIPDTAELAERSPAVFDGFFLMTKGDSATLYQTVDSIMAKGIPKEFGLVKEIRYEIVMVDQMSEDAVQRKMEAEQHQADSLKALGAETTKTLQARVAKYKAGKLRRKVQKTASGLGYIIHEKGQGAPIQKGETVQTTYIGVFKENGEVFDNSYDRGGPQAFPVGQMIPGFDEGLLLLNHGGKATLFIPWKLAYGEQGIPGGPIGPKTDLVFYIEIE